MVGYLNGNAQQIRSLECLSLNMDITHGIQQFNVPGRMICQKPRNFRMVAEMVGATSEAGVATSVEPGGMTSLKSHPNRPL